MCLDTVATGANAKKIEAKFEHTPRGTLIGYQMIRERERGVFTGLYYSPTSEGRIGANKWHKAVTKKETNWKRTKSYMTGFHAQHDPLVAQNSWIGEQRGVDRCLAKAELRGPFTFGRQYRHPIAVAAERRIVKILKRYPKEKES